MVSRMKKQESNDFSRGDSQLICFIVRADEMIDEPLMRRDEAAVTLNTAQEGTSGWRSRWP
jgi:hypothetical protein